MSLTFLNCRPASAGITRTFELVTVGWLLAGTCVAAEKPNIVLLFIDDWAWNESPVAMNDAIPNSRMPVLQMPHIERLACEGTKFTSAYTSPQCSPSRVCVQTGQSSPGSGFTVFMIRPRTQLGIVTLLSFVVLFVGQ